MSFSLSSFSSFVGDSDESHRESRSVASRASLVTIDGTPPIPNPNRQPQLFEDRPSSPHNVGSTIPPVFASPESSIPGPVYKTFEGVFSQDGQDMIRPLKPPIIQPSPNRFRLVYCPEVVNSGGKCFLMVEYEALWSGDIATDARKFLLGSMSADSRGGRAAQVTCGMDWVPARWAVVNHEGNTRLHRYMLYVACAAAIQLKLSWIWLDKLCVMPCDTSPGNSLQEAYMNASAVLSFPGSQGLEVGTANFNYGSPTDYCDFLRRPSTFLSLFTRGDNHWIIHKGSVLGTPDEKYPATKLHKWQQYVWTIKGGNTDPFKDLEWKTKELVYFLPGTTPVPAMTNIRILLPAVTYTMGLSLSQCRLHDDGTLDPSLNPVKLRTDIGTPTVIGKPWSKTNQRLRRRRCAEMAIWITSIFEMWKPVPGSDDKLRTFPQLQPEQCESSHMLMEIIWKMITMLTPSDPTSVTQVFAWALDYIYGHKPVSKSAISTCVFADLEATNLGDATWSINGPPLVFRHWLSHSDLKFLPTFMGVRRISYDIPIYIEGLDDEADHTRQKEFRYYVEFNQNQANESAPEFQHTWVVQGRAISLRAHASSSMKLEMDSQWDPHAEIMAVFVGSSLPKSSKTRCQKIVILRRNRSTRESPISSWHHEAVGSYQMTRGEDHQSFVDKLPLVVFRIDPLPEPGR